MPGVGDPVGHVAWQLRDQAASCAAMGSPLYAVLLRHAAENVEAGGPCWEVLSHHVAPGRGDALALRFMAAVHRLVLLGQAPMLAAHYPSVGGGAEPEATWPVFRATVAGAVEQLVELTALPCQTNEVGRTAGLVGGFLEIAAGTGLPLRILEVGASGGLNLRWDRFRYGGGGASWGEATSPVDLRGLWHVPPPRTDADVLVVERRGCDPRPVDPSTPEGRIALTASVWADQVARFARLRGALAVAQQVPAVVDRASLDDWVANRLDQAQPGVATVVYHSVVDEYLPDDVRERFHGHLAEAGGRATEDAPLAWLRLEPVSSRRSHGIELTTWPGGEHRVLAVCGAHGQDVRWLDADADADA